MPAAQSLPSRGGYSSPRPQRAGISLASEKLGSALGKALQEASPPRGPLGPPPSPSQVAGPSEPSASSAGALGLGCPTAAAGPSCPERPCPAPQGAGDPLVGKWLQLLRGGGAGGGDTCAHGVPGLRAIGITWYHCWYAKASLRPPGGGLSIRDRRCGRATWPRLRPGRTLQPDSSVPGSSPWCTPGGPGPSSPPPSTPHRPPQTCRCL